MPITLTAVPKSQRTRTPLEEIDPEIITAVKEALEYCDEHPDQRIAATFDTEAEAEEFLTDARSYAYQATPRLVVSGNVTRKGGGENRDMPQARFTVTRYQSESAASDAA